MNVLKVGDRERAACANCEAFVSVVYCLRDVPFSDGSGLVSQVLVGVCDQCDQVCVLPQQSTPTVKRALEKQRKPLESRVPAHMIDILNLASAEVGCGTEFVPYLIKYYVHALASQQISPDQLSRYLATDLAKGKAEKRISLKGQHIVAEVGELKALTRIDSTSDLIRGVILKINDDLVQHKRSKPLNELRGIAAAVG
jgi:DNA-binding helix-hairpin-helix protein with protein kinase domain